MKTTVIFIFFRVLLVLRVQWEKQGLSGHRGTLETLVQRVCVGFQALL